MQMEMQIVGLCKNFVLKYQAVFEKSAKSPMQRATFC